MPYRLIAVTCLLGWSLSLHGETQVSLWAMSLEELVNVPVASTPSGTRTPLDKAASITTVFTAEEIRRLGATNIDEVLQSVPGLFVGTSDQAYTSQYIFRGITSKTNPQALMLINGIPFKTLAFGNRTNIWRGMPVEAIKRIEVIRGPGSALYGADAFAGVINVITKSGRDADGLQTGASAGSFDRHSAWLQNGEDKGAWETFVSLEAVSIDGDDPVIPVDLQTQLDGLFASSSSFAPDRARTGYRSVDMRLEARSERVVARVGYQAMLDDEVSVGIAGSLDPQGLFDSHRASADVSYTRDDLLEDWVWTSRLNTLYVTQEPTRNAMLFPPGAFGGAFPEGMLGKPAYKEVQAGVEQLAVYSGLDNHLLRIAIGAEWGQIYETSDQVNFSIEIDPVLGVIFVPRGALVDVSDTEDVWLPERHRALGYLAVQDEWQLAPRWQLTSGLRYDHYSDFGDTINPRLALVWATTDTWTSRLLYGRAFRAPSFEELYVTSNPVVLGDPDLNPEVIDTVELALSWRDERERFVGLNLYRYDIRDYIERVPNGGGGQNRSANDGERRGFGAELEAATPLMRDVKLQGNYSWMRAEDKDSGEDVGEAPTQQAYLSLLWQLATHWQVSTQLNWFGEIERTAGDTRTALDDVAVVDLTVRRLKLFGTGEVTLRMRNLFDTEYAFPSPGPAATIPGDFPQPGFNGDVIFRYAF